MSSDLLLSNVKPINFQRPAASAFTTDINRDIRRLNELTEGIQRLAMKNAITVLVCSRRAFHRRQPMVKD